MALVFDNKTYRADLRLGESGVYGTFLFQLPVNDYSYVVTFINPRRACAARVTVLGLSVCLSVDSLIWQYRERGGL